MEKESSKVVALYARVSTLDQNCEVQLEDLRRHASKRFARCYEYTDAGVSGTQRHRPQLDALMRDARKRMFDVVLVWKFDRFARSLKHLIESLDEFDALGIHFISLTEGIDTTTSAGQLLFHIVGAVAQFERDLIAERVRAGMAHARAMGKQIGRPRAVVDVEAVTKLRQGDQSLREIAVSLNVPVPRVRRALLRLPSYFVTASLLRWDAPGLSLLSSPFIVIGSLFVSLAVNGLSICSAGIKHDEPSILTVSVALRLRNLAVIVVAAALLGTLFGYAFLENFQVRPNS